MTKFEYLWMLGTIIAMSWCVDWRIGRVERMIQRLLEELKRK